MTCKTFKTMCPMNCHPTLCGMTVRVEDDRLVSIEGDIDNPDSQGVLCIRGGSAHEIVNNPARLLKPMIREDASCDEWCEADWDECLDFIAQKMQAVGRESVGFWQGHGNAANDYGLGLKRAQMERFANIYGCQFWNPAMICWGLGALGFALTGALEASTKEDMSEHSELIVMWGANSVSQANTMKHVDKAKRRGVQLVVIDVRKTEAAALADDFYQVKPGADADLALAMMQVIISEDLVDHNFIEQHTLGYEALCEHVKPMTPGWAAERTGLSAEDIVKLARAYANTEASMIIVGGSSMHKGANTWQAARAISCLPGLTGKFGKPGGGIGPRHGSRSHGAGFVDISRADARPAGNYVPNQMEAIIESLETQTVKVLVTIGSNFLSSFPDTDRVRQALQKTELVVAYDIFSNQTIRDAAHVILPGTIWLEEIGGKSTHTHVYLSDQCLPIAGEARPVYELYRGLSARLGLQDVYPWESQTDAMNEVLDHQATGQTTVKQIRENKGQCELNISHIAYPNFAFHTPSGKLEFYSARATDMGLEPLPMPWRVETMQDENENPVVNKSASQSELLQLTHGRTFAHFHAFYDSGQALPTLKSREKNPQLWISPADAAQRGITNGDAIEMSNPSNQGSVFQAQAKVTDRIQTGVVWMRDGWPGLNAMTDGTAVVPETALSTLPFSVGQSFFGSRVKVSCAKQLR